MTTVEEIPCPDGPLLQRIFQGLAPAEQGEALANHVVQCPRCIEKLQLMRQYPPLPLLLRPTRPWKIYFLYAATLVILFAAIYSIVKQK